MVVSGAELEDALVSAIQQVAVSVLTAEFAEAIGGAYELAAADGTIDPIEFGLHKAAHAALGYATGLVTGDAEAGAIADLTGALVTDLLFDPSAEALDLAGQVNAGTLSEADMARALWDWQSQGMDLARLSAALAAFAAGADADGVRNAGDIGNNVAENNALETVWDLASLALSLNELGIAIENGDTLDIILAGGAVVIDGIAVALPGAPGGAGAALSVSRETGDVVLTQVDDAGRAVETTLGNVNDLRTGAGSQISTEIKKYPDGSYRTPDGKFASQGGVPSPGSKSAKEYTQFLRENGFDVLGEELTVTAPIGIRRYDAIVRDNNGELWGIEYKSGGARKTPQQDFNDMYISRYGAQGVGKIDGENVVGNLTIYLP